MNRDTIEYIRSCSMCRSDKDPRGVTPAPIQRPRTTIPVPFHTIHCDTFGPLVDSTGYKYIIGFVCAYKRYSEVNGWQYRVSYLNLPNSHNVWVEFKDLPPKLQHLASIIHNSIPFKRCKNQKAPPPQQDLDWTSMSTAVLIAALPSLLLCLQKLLRIMMT